MRLGVIADTHGLLRSEAVAALDGCDRILHAGDVGAPQVLAGLRAVAPVVAVRGNVDAGELAGLPRSEAVDLEGTWIWLQHGHEGVDVDPAAGGFALVVVGHSHRPGLTLGRAATLNPGSAGPRRFSLPVTLALVEVEPVAAGEDATPAPTVGTGYGGAGDPGTGDEGVCWAADGARWTVRWLELGEGGPRPYAAPVVRER